MLLNRIVQDLQREAQRRPSAAPLSNTRVAAVSTLTLRERQHLYAFMASDLGLWRIDQQHSCLESRCDLIPDGIVGFTLPGRPHDQVRICRASGQHHLCGKHKCRYMIRGSWMARGRSASTDVNENHQWYCIYTLFPKDADLVAEDWQFDEEVATGMVHGDADQAHHDAWIRGAASDHLLHRLILGEDDDTEESRHEPSEEDEHAVDDASDLQERPAKRRRVQSPIDMDAASHALATLGSLSLSRPLRGRGAASASRRAKLANRDGPALSFEKDALRRIMEHPELRRHIFFRPAPSSDAVECDWWELSRTWPVVRLQGIPRDHEETEAQYHGRMLDVMSYVDKDMNCIQPDLRYVAEFDLTTLHSTWDAAGAMFYKTSQRTSKTSVPVVCEDYYWNDHYTADITQMFIRRMENLKQRRASQKIPEPPPKVLNLEHTPTLTGPLMSNILNFYTTTWNRDGFPVNRGELIRRCTAAELDLSPMLTLLYILALDIASNPTQFATQALKQSAGAAASHSRRFGWFGLCAAMISAPDMSCPDMYWWPKSYRHASTGRDNETEKASEVLQNYISRSLSDVCDQVAYVCIHRLPRASGYMKDCDQKQMSRILGKI